MSAIAYYHTLTFPPELKACVIQLVLFLVLFNGTPVPLLTALWFA